MNIATIVNKIYYHNRDYSKREIKIMVETAIFELKNPSFKAVYLTVLNRILEEKGYKYIGNKLTNPIERGYLEHFSSRDQKRHEGLRLLLNTIFIGSKLSQNEIFAILLFFQMDSVPALNEKRQKIIDTIEESYYMRKLTIKEISKIIGLKEKETRKLKFSAIEKMKRYLKA
jgi:hypothetical protein